MFSADCMSSASAVSKAASELETFPKVSQNLAIYGMCTVRRGGVIVMVAPVRPLAPRRRNFLFYSNTMAVF